MIRDYFYFSYVLCLGYLTAREHSNYWLHLLFSFLFCFFVFINKQRWVFKIYFIDRHIVVFFLLMFNNCCNCMLRTIHVSCVIGLICSVTAGYCKSNLIINKVTYIYIYIYIYIYLWIGSWTLCIGNVSQVINTNQYR